MRFPTLPSFEVPEADLDILGLGHVLVAPACPRCGEVRDWPRARGAEERAWMCAPCRAHNINGRVACERSWRERPFAAGIVERVYYTLPGEIVARSSFGELRGEAQSVLGSQACIGCMTHPIEAFLATIWGVRELERWGWRASCAEGWRECRDAP